MTTYRRVVSVRTTVRFELTAPVSAKDLSTILSTLQQEFMVKNGRSLKFDNDYWLEPTDEGVAFCYLVERSVAEEKQSDDKEEDPIASLTASLRRYEKSSAVAEEKQYDQEAHLAGFHDDCAGLCGWVDEGHEQ